MRSNWKFLIGIAFSWINLMGMGQSIPELERRLARLPADTQRLKCLSDLSWEYLTNDLDRAEQYAKEEFALAQKIGPRHWEAMAWNDLGIVAFRRLHYRKALDYNKKALNIRLQLGDPLAIGSSYSKMGLSLSELQRLPEALDAQLKALACFRKSGTKTKVAYTLNNINYIYLELKQIGKIKPLAREAWNISVETGDLPSQVHSLNYLSSAYEAEGDLNTALDLTQKAFGIASHMEDTTLMATLQNNLGYCFNQSGQIDKARVAYQKALKLARAFSLKDTNSIVLYQANLASQEHRHGQIQAAIHHLREALFMSQLSGLPKHLAQIYKSLGDAFVTLHQADSAQHYYGLFSDVKESSFSADMAKRFSDMQSQYEIDIRENQKAILAKNLEIKSQRLRQYQFGIGGLVLILILSGIIFVQWRNRQRLIQQRALEQERWKQEKERSLAILSAEEAERQRIGRDLHDGVGQQLSAARMQLSVIESSLSQTDDAETKRLQGALTLMDEAVKEVRSVSHIMLANALQKLGLEGAIRDFMAKLPVAEFFTTEVEISGLDEPVDPAVQTMVYRITQELVNNVLKHAKATRISLQLHRYPHELLLMVEDNGIGFDPEAVSDGAGMQSILSRVAFINGQVFFDSSPGNGTTVTVEVPFPKN